MPSVAFDLVEPGEPESEREVRITLREGTFRYTLYGELYDKSDMRKIDAFRIHAQDGQLYLFTLPPDENDLLQRIVLATLDENTEE